MLHDLFKHSTCFFPQLFFDIKPTTGAQPEIFPHFFPQIFPKPKGFSISNFLVALYFILKILASTFCTLLS